MQLPTTHHTDHGEATVRGLLVGAVLLSVAVCFGDSVWSNQALMESDQRLTAFGLLGVGLLTLALMLGSSKR